MDTVKNMFNNETMSDTAAIVNNSLGTNKEEDDCCPSMDWSTRLQGFAFCFGIGMILSIGGSVNIFLMNYPAFAILYSLGSVVSLCSSMFLRGPISQCKSMADPTRAITTAVMLVFLVLTLLAGLVWKKAGLTLLFFVIQYLASIWYLLSYIPFARDGIVKCFDSCMA